QPFPSLGTFISTLSQRRDAGGRGFAIGIGGPLTGPLGIRHTVRELPPICSNVRQKQRLSIDTLPQEVKAPFPCDPVIPLRTKTTKEFQEDVERAAQSGDWREVREFYLTTFDSFVEINAAFKREANGLFNTIEDSGVNGKFVSAVYDSLLSTPQDIQKLVLKGIINSLLREWKGPRTKDDLRAYFVLIQVRLKHISLFLTGRLNVQHDGADQRETAESWGTRDSRCYGDSRLFLGAVHFLSEYVESFLTSVMETHRVSESRQKYGRSETVTETLNIRVQVQSHCHNLSCIV
uniref:HECT domain E3 ubiquitin protein ligase 2 n=2 Tax=Poecilia latipinna TaxID=48699 RepID=A0A3B3UUW2_9TELE